jgi:hypothetical protein
MNKELDITNITNEKDGDVIFVTVAKYKLFMSKGKIGIDAYCLYSHMMFTARLQETNQVWANDSYLRKGLSWSKERVQKAKQLLIELELISEIIKRDENGKFTGKYIKVITKTTPFEINEPEAVLPSAGFTDSGETDTNALTNKDKCLNEKVNAEPKKVKKEVKQKKQFIPPTQQQVKDYCEEKKLNIDVFKFIAYYEASNWRNKYDQPVQNWKQTAVTWHKKTDTELKQEAYERDKKKYYGG